VTFGASTVGSSLVIEGHGARIELQNDGKIRLNDEAKTAAGVARVGDGVTSNMTADPVFWTWLSAAAAVLAGLGVVAPTPTALASKITEGSATVKAGG
jgi:hypothetical protein